MATFAKALILILMGLPSTVLNPYFWIVVLLVWMQYKKVGALEMRILGAHIVEPRKKVFNALAYGILGGVAGSITVVIFGVVISETGLIFVWPLALLLALIDPHYMCFSYAGGIISLVSLIFGVPKIDVAGLMALIAVLHMVESILIYFSGHLHSTPIYIEDSRYGVVGGFSLQEFWPVPIMLLLAISGTTPTGEVLEMPDWWPIMRASIDMTQDSNLIFMMFPVMAALGYGDIAITTTPKERCALSARNLSIFSGILLALSVMASKYTVLKYVAAIFAPLAHETLILLGKKTERTNPPIFTPSPRGERILYVKKDSYGEKMGLCPGDLLIQANGKALNTPGSLESVLENHPPYLWIDYETRQGKTGTTDIKAYPDGVGDLGVLMVPKGQWVPTIKIQKKATLARLLQRFTKTS